MALCVRSTFVILFLLLAAFPGHAADVSSSRIDAVTRTPALRHASWGILVEDGNGRVLYERNADTLMSPASVRKLFSAATVLSCYGIDGVLSTGVSITGFQTGRVLKGDLVIRGGGDPSLGGRWEYDSDRNARLQSIVKALKRLGIERIEGELVVDVSAFDDELIPGSWKSDNIGNAWAAPVDAIAFNENVIGVKVVGRRPAEAVVALDPEFASYHVENPCTKSKHVVGVSAGNVVTVGCARSGNGTLSYLLAVDDPALYVAQAIRAFLVRSGIEVGGIRTTRDAVGGDRPLVALPSPPIGMLLSAVLEDSANLYAEMLLKSTSAGDSAATYEASLGIERAFLTGVVGIDEGEFAFDDGCGLSPEDAVTPRATVRLLHYIEQDAAWSVVVRDAVPSPGEGTLRKRLEGLEGRVFAKTGSIDGVNALAGWVIGERGGLRRFAIFINHHTAPGKKAMNAIDDIVRVIAEF